MVSSEQSESEIMTSKSKQNSTITTKEIRALRRVYDKLCFISDKKPKFDRISFLDKKMLELKIPGNKLESIQPAIDMLDKERKKVENELKEITSRHDQHIRSQDTRLAMNSLGERLSKKEINSMMWEVDEKLDGVIDWEEFKLMFERNIKDTSGLEPSNFYNMAQFMIYDHDGNGMVSIDETMNMLYARVGRTKMETTITKLFGGEDGAPIKEVGQQGGEIDFQRYCDVVKKEQLKMFRDSDFGRTLHEKKKATEKIAK